MASKSSVFLACAAALAVCVSPVSAERRPYSGIVVFGTSLSDSGNAFALRGGTNTPPDYALDPLLIPSAPYARGGHHFSNGATWVEQLARSLAVPGSVRPALASSSRTATNYAVGAARSYDDGQNFNLSAQVQAFLVDYGGEAPSDALYVIEMGGNDIRDALVAYETGGFPAAESVLEQALAAIAQNIQLLYRAGAREFLVWLPPDVGLTPAIQMLNQARPGVAQLATGLTHAFNTGLGNLLTQLSAFPGLSVAPLDANALLTDIVARPQEYGMANVRDACVTPRVAPFFCGRPDEYLFWDGIHPSRATHAIVAAAAAGVLALDQ